jgi:hypothetical protein
VSLLSELIAQLNALIEQNRRTASDMQGARETVEGAAALVQAATVDSRNPLVERGIGQWLAAMEKLGEARVLLTAGDRSMSDYLHGRSSADRRAHPVVAIRQADPWPRLRGRASHLELATLIGRRR